MYRSLMTIVATASIAACSNLVPLSHVSSAEAKWNRSKIQNYDYIVQVNTMSPDTACSPGDRIEVQVRHGETVKFGTCPPHAVMALAFGSIPKLFATIRATRSERPPRYAVKFDADLGYPQYIDANYSRMMSDYSVRYFIRDFRPTE
jgi:Family of unknown function (DUF6174)